MTTLLPALARTAAALLSSGALLAGAAVVAAPGAAAATLCETDCLGAVTVTPYPDGARINATTTGPASLSVEAWFGATKVASWSEPADTGYVTNHVIDQVSGLKPRTWYTFKVTAADNYGHTRTESYVARTAYRTTTVSFDGVYVYDDGDASGAGDMVIGSSVAGVASYAGTGWTNTYPMSSWNQYSLTGAWNLKTTVTNSHTPMPVKFTMLDDDDDTVIINGGAGTCFVGVGAPWGSMESAWYSFGSGSDDCADWSTASGNLALTNAIGTSVQPFEITTPAGSVPHFAAQGKATSTVVNVPAAPPSAPSVTEVGNGAVRLTWSASPQANGAAITGYTATASTGQTCTTTGLSCVVSGLTNGTPVTFRVTARNSEGDSAASAQSLSATPLAVPNAPGVAAVASADGKLTITLLPSGPAATAYYVEAVGSGISAQGTGTTLVLSGLTNGKAYALRALAKNALGWSLETRTSAVYTPYKASTLTGFDTTTVNQLPGTTVSDLLVVGPAGSGRKVTLQYRRVGAAGWTSGSVLTANAAGQVAVSLPVKQGLFEWRAVAQPSGIYGPAYSASRRVNSVSTVSGFLTTTFTAKAGATTTDAITIKPGAFRTVTVQYRKDGSATWTTYASLAADAAGNVTITEKVFTGKYHWRVYVAESALYGTAVASASRVVNAL